MIDTCKFKKLSLSLALSANLLLPAALPMPARAQVDGVTRINASITQTDTPTNSAPVARTANSSLTHMPVKEVTIFKDGHALLVHEGQMPVSEHGDVMLEDLPKPVLGTFFPYSLEPQARLQGVTAGRKKIERGQTALTVPELIAANIGALVHIDELIGAGDSAKIVSYDARIAGIPTRSAEELARTGEDSDPDLILPQKSNLVKLKTETGFSYVPIERIQTLSFKEEPGSVVKEENLRNTLTMNLDWQGKSAAKAKVGMMYLEKGIRWIPNYKVTIDGQGHANVKLQATLVNDLTDLKDVSCNLVVGVPSFAFKGEVDPISLAETLARVAPNAAFDSNLRRSFTNSIMSQSVGYANDDRQAETPTAPTAGTKNEDLFVFNLKHLTLKKGERIVVPVQDYNVDYKDLYAMDVPLMPPQEVHIQAQSSVSQSEGMRMAEANKVVHKIRLFNSSKQPFTTAPALIAVASDTENPAKAEVLAQGMMTYTSPGSNTDLTLTNAVDIKGKVDEKEIARTPDATTWQDTRYAKVSLGGQISLTNYTNKAVTVEITRKVLGRLDSVSKGGTMTMTNTIDEMKSSDLPPWWGYYSWPGWWSYMNGIGKFTFTETIQPGKTIKVDYGWHYFWR